LAGTFTGSIRTKALEKFGRKGSMGVFMQGSTVEIFGVPYFRRNGYKATNFKFGRYTQRVNPKFRTNAHYKFGRKGSLGVAYPCRDAHNF